MVDAKRQHDWGQTSSVIAAMYEVNRDRKRRRRPFAPSEFNPLLQTSCEVRPITITVAQLTEILGRSH